MEAEKKPQNIALKVVISVVIGIAVVLWLFKSDFNASVLSSLVFDRHTVAALGLALLFVIGRDFGLAWRFRTITDRQLTWRQAFRVDLMCAFTSAITPSAVGGSAWAVFYLNREGVSVGRATTLTLTTLFLDELFFVVFCPILVLMLPSDSLFGRGGGDLFLDSVQVVFWLVYSCIVAYTILLFCGIILWPHKVEWLLNKVCSWRWLHRWQKAVAETGANLVATSAWVKSCDKRWWLNVFGATVVSWFSRYLVVNSLFWGFVPAASGLLVFGRQFVVWVLLMISPTPGGSGVSEWLFTTYYGDLIGSAGVALILAMIWRLLSYYDYILAGVILLPSYFRKNKTQKK